MRQPHPTPKVMIPSDQQQIDEVDASEVETE